MRFDALNSSNLFLRYSCYTFLVKETMEWILYSNWSKFFSVKIQPFSWKSRVFFFKTEFFLIDADGPVNTTVFFLFPENRLKKISIRAEIESFFMGHPVCVCLYVSKPTCLIACVCLYVCVYLAKVFYSDGRKCRCEHRRLRLSYLRTNTPHSAHTTHHCITARGIRGGEYCYSNTFANSLIICDTRVEVRR